MSEEFNMEKGREAAKTASSISETQTDALAERIAKTKAVMNKNTEQAIRNAESKLARLEYSDSYRQKLAAKENRQAREDKMRREAEENEAKRILDAEREREIAEFKRIERENAKKRAFETERLLSAMGAAEQKKIVPKSDEENLEDEKNIKSETAQNLKKSDTPVSESGAFEPIILKIEPKLPNTPASAAVGDDNVLRVDSQPAREAAKYIPPCPIVYAGAPYPMPQYMQNPCMPPSQSAPISGNASVPKASKPTSAKSKPAPQKPAAQKPGSAQNPKNANAAKPTEKRADPAAAVTAPAANKNETEKDLPHESVREPRIEYPDDSGRRDSAYKDPEYPDYDRDKEYDTVLETESDYTREYDKNEEGKYADEIQARDTENRDARAYEEELDREKSIKDTDLDGQGRAAINKLAEEDDIRSTADRLDAERLDDLYSKKALVKYLNEYHKKKTELEKKIRKLKREQESATIQRNAALTVAKIGIQKEIIELTVDSVMACRYAKSKSYLSKQRLILEKAVDDYNGFCDEYERLSGKQLPKISETMPYEVSMGHVPDPIPNIYYSDEDNREVLKKNGIGKDGINDYGAYDSRHDIHDILTDESPSFVTEEESKERRRAAAEKTAAVKKAIERDMIFISLRNEYLLQEYEKQRDMAAHSFSVSSKEANKRFDEIENKAEKQRVNARKAVKYEMDDNARYYALLSGEERYLKIKKRSNIERAEALKMRLEVLLSEREALNERLIALYGGSGKRSPSAKIAKKAASVRRKHAAKMYNKNKAAARKIELFKAPLDMKEKAFNLLNKKIENAALIEENIYKLKRLKPKGAMRCELVCDIKRAKQAIKQADADLKFLMKKMKRHEEIYMADRNWGILWLVIAILATVGIIIGVLYGSAIKTYFINLYLSLMGKGG